MNGIIWSFSHIMIVYIYDTVNPSRRWKRASVAKQNAVPLDVILEMPLKQEPESRDLHNTRDPSGLSIYESSTLRNARSYAGKNGK